MGIRSRLIAVRGNGWKRRLVCLLGSFLYLTAVVKFAAPQQGRPTTRPPTRKLTLPYGPVRTLAAPDGAHVLYGVPYLSGMNSGPELWIEDTRTGQRRLLLSIAGTLDAEWSPDGAAFSVNDRRASDSTLAYVYDSNGLSRIDIADRIRTADPGTERFQRAHAYFDVDRWEDPQNVIVRFHGHTDDAPVVRFDLRYRVSRAGLVQNLD